MLHLPTTAGFFCARVDLLDCSLRRLGSPPPAAFCSGPLFSPITGGPAAVPPAAAPRPITPKPSRVSDTTT
ncbi:hypothetical protein Hanom_Chr01g00067491 [Helianthus anomalus]